MNRELQKYLLQYTVYGVVVALLALSSFTYTVNAKLTELAVKQDYTADEVKRMDSVTDELSQATQELLQVTSLMRYQLEQQRTSNAEFKEKLDKMLTRLERTQ